ncbi:unnamed protein product [Malus baccata var. baccata]
MVWSSANAQIDVGVELSVNTNLDLLTQRGTTTVEQDEERGRERRDRSQVLQRVLSAPVAAAANPGGKQRREVQEGEVGERGMNADGQICAQRAVDKAGKEFATGHLDFTPENGGIKVGRNQGDLFQAYTLMKVNNEDDGDAKFKDCQLGIDNPLRFVLPSKGGRVRPETFPMACLMAQGSRVSLAPIVLGYIYHGLGDIVSCPRGPSFTYISMPVHYIVGWLGEHFPYLYRSHPDSDFPQGYPQLVRYAGIEPREVSISHARFIFRSNKSVIYRPTVFVEEKDYSLMDNEDLSDDYFEFFEPYFPNRFPRQFGFDQGVPVNKLAFGVSSRLNCNAEDMFETQAVLLKRNTGSVFFVPCSTHQGICTYWYCKWWRTSCATYLGTSLADIYAIFNKRPLNKKTVFSVSVLRDISPSIRKEVLLSKMGIEKSPSLQPVGQTDKKCKAIPEFSSSGSSLGSSRDVNFKHARYEKPDDLNGVDIGTVVATDTGNFTPEMMSKNSNAPSLHAKVVNQPYREKSDAYVSDGVVPSSLQEVKTSIHALFGLEVSNLRQEYIIGEVENIFVRLSSCNSPTKILGCREEVNLVFDVLRPIINLLESGQIELERFVKTVRHVFVCASQISDNAGIIDQGNQIHDFFRRHDECLSTKKALESELTNSIQELKKIKAEELPVKETEEVARVLHQQYDSGKLAVKRRVSDLKASIERQKKLDVELRQSRIDANEGLLSDVACAEALNKSAEEGNLHSIASLLHFCSKPE